MIRHRPFGSGHPYSVDTEQRSPVDPIAGEPLTLGVRTSANVTSVQCEVLREAGSTRHSLEPVTRHSRGQAIDGGHLASAQARLARTSGGWQLTFDDLVAHEGLKYRFHATHVGGTIEKTRWFDVRVFSWRSADDAISAAGQSKVIDKSIEVLDDGQRIHRLRFALPLQPGEHVTGLGERFNALDHRGAALDSVVFEQYKNQGAERKTYMPMPFAHIVGGTGWGFHLRTSRRAWFDFGATVADRALVEVDVDAATDAPGILEVAFYDGRPSEVLQAFLREVGAPEELPSWVFRLWASGNEWNTQNEVLRQADLHREHEIPVGSIVIEAWSDESTFTVWRDARYNIAADGGPLRLDDFEFPAEGAWPDPKGMIDELHDRDIRLVLWQIPLIKTRPHPTGQVRADAEAAISDGYVVQELAPD
uniref:TIM-barrel domain-containing protein n=1 Tax=Salinibacterium sp. TaxID=1915057 RepID=UPI00286B9B0C